MPRRYHLTHQFTGVTTARDLAVISAPSTRTVRVVRAQFASLGAANQQFTVGWQRVTALGSLTATDITPRKVESGDGAAATTCKANVTAGTSTYSSGEVLDLQTVMSLTGYRYTAGDITLAPSEMLALRLLSPASPTSFDGSILIEIEETG